LKFIIACGHALLNRYSENMVALHHINLSPYHKRLGLTGFCFQQHTALHCNN